MVKPILLIFFCLNNLAFLIGQSAEADKTFSCQLYQVRNNVILHYTGKSIEGTRTQESILSPISENSIFKEANVRVSRYSDGSLQVSAYDTNTWFIPVDMGTNPVKLLPGYCIRMLCFRKTYYEACHECDFLDLYDRITVIGGIDAQCLRAYLIGVSFTHCDSLYPYEYYSGGVIANAQNVKITDPDWYKPNPNGKLLFKVDDNGNIIGPIHKGKKD